MERSSRKTCRLGEFQGVALNKLENTCKATPSSPPSMVTFASRVAMTRTMTRRDEESSVPPPPPPPPRVGVESVPPPRVGVESVPPPPPPPPDDVLVRPPLLPVSTTSMLAAETTLVLERMEREETLTAREEFDLLLNSLPVSEEVRRLMDQADSLIRGVGAFCFNMSLHNLLANRERESGRVRPPAPNLGYLVYALFCYLRENNIRGVLSQFRENMLFNVDSLLRVVESSRRSHATHQPDRAVVETETRPPTSLVIPHSESHLQCRESRASSRSGTRADTE